MIAILNCPCFKWQRLARIFGHLAGEALPTTALSDLEQAAKIVIPDGGSFRQMVRELRDGQLVGPLMRAAGDGRSILGISRGMHLLFDVGFEEGQHTGLGLLPGKAIQIEFGDHPASRHFTVPHRGWNQVRWTGDCPLLGGLSSGEYFYFDHGFHAEPLDSRHILATCNHGVDFAAAAGQGRVFGVQFLPEKSEEAGTRLLANFAAM